MVLGVELTVTEVVRDGRREEKLKAGKLEVLMGSETAGRSSTSATYRQSTNMKITLSPVPRRSALNWEKQIIFIVSGYRALTSSFSGRLEGRALLLSLFILPPAVLELLAAGVLERG